MKNLLPPLKMKNEEFATALENEEFLASHW